MRVCLASCRLFWPQPTDGRICLILKSCGFQRCNEPVKTELTQSIILSLLLLFLLTIKIWVFQNIQSIYKACEVDMITLYSGYYTKPLVRIVFSTFANSERASSFADYCTLLLKMYNKAIIRFAFRTISKIIKSRNCVVCRSRRMRQCKYLLLDEVEHDTAWIVNAEVWVIIWKTN